MLSKLGKSRVLMSLLSVVAIGVLYGSSWDLTLKHVGRLNSNLCGCQKCLTEGDPWFKELINASPEPFLSRKYTTAEETFDWWKGLQSETRNFTFYNKTVDDLFQTFPQSPDVVESSPDRCRTCAVVGNSGNLRRSHYGPLIDFHDIVIRMNRGRTKGYEADVGTKTTHHVMYPESAVNLDNTTHLVLFAFKMNDLLWLLRKFNSGENNAVNSKRIANKDLVMILNPAFMKYAHEEWLGRKGKYPSTGFMTLLFSMYICDEVNVFGFGADRDGNWNHYYEILRNKGLKTGPHPGKQEYEIIHQLHHTEKIVFYKGF